MLHVRSHHSMFPATALITTIALLAAPVATNAQTAVADATAITAGVREIMAPGIVGSVCVYGKNAFPIVVGKSGNYNDVVVAGARYGKGRLIAFGHDGYLRTEALDKNDTAELLLNAVRWAANGKPNPRVGVLPQWHAGTAELLKARGIADVQMLPPVGGAKRLREFDVVVGVFSEVPESEQAAYTAFAKAGGGLIGAETGWGWLSIHSGKTLWENGGNRIFAGAGLLWTGGMADRTTKDGFATTEPLPAGINASNALDALLAGRGTKDEIAQSVWTVGQTLQALPPGDSSLRSRLSALRKSHKPDFSNFAAKPMTTENPLDRLFLTQDIRAAMSAPPEAVTAHPAAASFPGAVPAAASRITKTITVDTNIPDWHSTGLYAAPGETVTVTVPAMAAKLGLNVQIGTHKDILWHLPTWKRVPEITRSFPIKATEIRVANAFGGAILIDVPEGCPPSLITVTVKGAVAAPYFVRGKTSLTEWRETIRNAAAPWAELQGDRCILSVPSTVVRTLDDPEAVMAYWDAVMDAAADLYAVPRERQRQERYCVDRQISAGYMHSGYPIMTWEDVAERFVDLKVLRGPSGGENWGFYHELGHNHQRPAWTWDGCGEVTNNLFSLYACELFNAITPDYKDTNLSLTPEKRKKVIAEYVAAGAPYEKWKSEPFTALILFIQLRQEFGWEPFKSVFAEYERLPESELPKSDIQRRDQFMVRFSHKVNKNLGPFFTAWGIPTTESARQSITALPAWMPADLSDALAKRVASHP